VQILNKHHNPPPAAIVLQKIDPSDMFGWTKQPTGGGAGGHHLHGTAGQAFQKTLGYHETYNYTDASGAAPSKWPQNVYGNVVIAPHTVLEENNSFSLTRQASLEDNSNINNQLLNNPVVSPQITHHMPPPPQPPAPPAPV
jgi:hypothetical protein